MRKKIENCLIIIAYAVIAVAIAIVVRNNGTYPSGSDTMCHIYKGDILYNSIKNGKLYPLYDPLWYNGVEMMRYWAPLPVYFLAFCQALAGGDALNGYLVFNSLVFFLGALVFYIIGNKAKRRYLGAFFGVLWFFMPNNIFALYNEGNLPRTLSMVILPLFMYCMAMYLINGQKSHLISAGITFVFIILCHSGYAGMIALSLFVYFFVNGIINRTWVKGLNAIVTLLASFMITGIWLVPSLIGGITNTDSSEVMSGFFQSFFVSVNPVYRILHGNDTFYIGFAAFVAALFGTVFAKKKSQTGFISALVIFFLTSLTAYPVLKILPGSQYLWMLRFISIGLIMILISFLIWDSLRKWILVILCGLLVLDVVPSLELMTGYRNKENVYERLDRTDRDTLIEKAKSITKQRMALIDLSTLGATGAYLVSDYKGGVAATFGAGWQSAATATNIVQLNRAFEGGCFNYLFDRALELGNDTVLIKMSGCDWKKYSVKSMEVAALLRSYKLVTDNGAYRLYHRDTPDCFGVVSHFDAIGIGSGTPYMSLDFPDIEETESTNLNDYTFEELSKYETVYLNGFTYDNKAKAEELILKLSESGVRVVILADGIPENPATKQYDFLGVRCNLITFSNGYPELLFRDKLINPDLFEEGFETWNTVYMTGLDNVLATTMEDDIELPFYGTVYNDNIIMLGINLTYHYALTKDRAIEGILSEIFGIDAGRMPVRQVVPIEIEYGVDKITITASEKLNTTLAFHDNFVSDSPIESRNRLLFVEAGTTVIDMKYPYLMQGLLVSLFGIALMILIGVGIKPRKRKE